jgi:hypothetical protein
MKPVYCLVLISFVLASCLNQPSKNSVDIAIAQTLTAQPASNKLILANTNTPEPSLLPSITNTSRPTKTSTPRPTTTPTRSREEIRLEFTQLWVDVIEKNVNDVEIVTMSRINNGRLEIELRTVWASKDSQPDISYDVVQIISEVLVGSNMSPETAAEIVGGDKFVVDLVTYSTNGDYRYESTTNYDTLVKIKNKSISYDEWVTTSNAGFR